MPAPFYNAGRFYQLIRDFAVRTPNYATAIRYQTKPDERGDLTLVSKRVYGTRDEALTIQAAAGLQSPESELLEQRLVLPTPDQLRAIKLRCPRVKEPAPRIARGPGFPPPSVIDFCEAVNTIWADHDPEEGPVFFTAEEIEVDATEIGNGFSGGGSSVPIAIPVGSSAQVRTALINVTPVLTIVSEGISGSGGGPFVNEQLSYATFGPRTMHFRFSLIRPPASGDVEIAFQVSTFKGNGPVGEVYEYFTHTWLEADPNLWQTSRSFTAPDTDDLYVFLIQPTPGGNDPEPANASNATHSFILGAE